MVLNLNIVGYRTFCIMGLQDILLILTSRNSNELKYNCSELINNCCINL